MPNLHRKPDKAVHAPLTLKVGAADGSVEALFSVYNTIDSVGDVVLSGAFVDGQEVPMAAWSHNWGRLAVGKGTIHSTPAGAVFSGQFFLNTEAGREHYETVKAMGSLQEWSFGFNITDSEPGTFNGQPVRFLKQLETYEVSPVLVGANRDTRTLALKSLDSTAFAIAFEAAMSTDGPLEEQITAALVSLRSQADQLPADPTFTDPPTEASDDGADPSTERFADQYERVLLEVSTLATRSAEIADLRAKAGRVLSDANRRRLSTLSEQLGELQTQIADLLTSTEPAPPTEDLEKTARQQEMAALYAHLCATDDLYQEVDRLARRSARGDH